LGRAKEFAVNTTPTRPPAIEPTSIFSGLRPKAIIIGAIVDTVATLVASMVLFILLAVKHSVDLTEEIPDEVFDELLSTPEGLFWGLILGGLCTVLGGYIGASRAGDHFVRHGAFVGCTSLLIALIGFVFLPSGSSAPLWYDLLGVVVIIPCGASGGWLAEQRIARRAP
jgi:peptidoglycan/LPS O-acetylase OafA/YrhL